MYCLDPGNDNVILNFSFTFFYFELCITQFKFFCATGPVTTNLGMHRDRSSVRIWETN